MANSGKGFFSGIGEPAFGPQPGTHCQNPSRPQGGANSADEHGLIEEVFGTFDDPNAVEAVFVIQEVGVFHSNLNLACQTLPVDAAPCDSRLDRAYRQADDGTPEFPGEPD
jgi:hypothetical protein